MGFLDSPIPAQNHLAMQAASKVLNPTLYARMVQRFGQIIVSQPGCRVMSMTTHAMSHGNIYKSGEYYRASCFAGETLVATQTGDVPIKDLVGKATLLIPNKKGLGSWKEVEVRHFGKQPLLTVTLSRGKTVKRIRATPEHGWVTSGRIGLYVHKTTQTLQPGDRIPLCSARVLASYANQKSINLSTPGIMQGFVFGDGSHQKLKKKSADVTIHTDAKNAAVLPFFAGCRQTTKQLRGREATTIHDLPRFWKRLPPSDESLSFLYGWLAGYFAADGTVSRNGNQATLNSANPMNLQFAKGILYQLGVQVSPVRPTPRYSEGCVPGAMDRPMYGLSFAVRDMPVNFWLVPHHRQYVESRTGKEVRKQWTVKSIQNHNEVEDVYCAVVPERQMFTLADNVLTKNCPFCGDTRQRLFISYMYGQLDQNGRQLLHLAHCFNEECTRNPENREKLQNWLLGFQNLSQREAIFELAKPDGANAHVAVTPVLPEGLIPISELMDRQPNHPAVLYMVNDRQYTRQMLDHYEVSYCWQSQRFPQAGNRIIFPLYMHKRLVGWQARYIGTPPVKTINKYYGMPGMHKQAILYNFDNCLGKPFLALFEGVTDVHRLGDYANALLGKTVSPTHLMLLTNHFKKTPIFVGLDPDAANNRDRVVRELRQAELLAFPLSFPNELDPSDMEQAALIALIRGQARSFGISI